MKNKLVALAIFSLCCSGLYGRDYTNLDYVSSSLNTLNTWMKYHFPESHQANQYPVILASLDCLKRSDVDDIDANQQDFEAFKREYKKCADHITHSAHLPQPFTTEVAAVPCLLHTHHLVSQ